MRKRLEPQKSLTNSDDFFRDKFRTGDDSLTGVVSYYLVMPSALWFIAQVADALTALAIDGNWEQSGIQTIDDTLNAAAVMLGSFQPMIGFIFPIALAAPPVNMLLCDGTTYLRVDYPLLYAALDSAFIVDADHFITPDLRDRVVYGASGTYAPGAAFGESTHTLIVAETPSHTHTDTGHAHVEGIAVLSAAQTPVVPIPSAIPGAGVTAIGNANLTSTGGDGAHNNLQPSMALKYGIVAL